MSARREGTRAEVRRRARQMGPKYEEIPRHEWPAVATGGITRLFQNNRFIALVYDHSRTPEGEAAVMVRLRPNNSKPLGPSLFRHLQDAKNQLLGPEARGVTYLPKESELQDEANMYWFYVRTGGPS